jgi:SAM-dependent methyltransferase
MSEKQPFRGLCNICGWKGEFAPREGLSTRESYACGKCRANQRYRDQAALIIDEFSKGRSAFLSNAVSSGHFSDVHIYEPALKGPFVSAFKALPQYVRSYFWPDRPFGTVNADGVRNEDITSLTFADNSFDLVITSDVMEHVYDYQAAFSEISRVLRRGGIHVFSIPNDWPFPTQSVRRVEMRDGVEHHIKPARYHNSGDGAPCIVYTDFGADLIDSIDAAGKSRTQAVRRHSAIDPCYVNATFVTRKLA